MRPTAPANKASSSDAVLALSEMVIGIIDNRNRLVMQPDGGTKPIFATITEVGETQVEIAPTVVTEEAKVLRELAAELRQGPGEIPKRYISVDSRATVPVLDEQAGTFTVWVVTVAQQEGIPVLSSGGEEWQVRIERTDAGRIVVRSTPKPIGELGPGIFFNYPRVEPTPSS